MSVCVGFQRIPTSTVVSTLITVGGWIFWSKELSSAMYLLIFGCSPQEGVGFEGKIRTKTGYSLLISFSCDFRAQSGTGKTATLSISVLQSIDIQV